VQDRYEIRGVMGPDEYHDADPDLGTPGLRNNTYTNIMVVWVLRRGPGGIARTAAALSAGVH
jgi:trehalose/maltose hydrolase-like predicted phosphorylase